MRTTNGGGTTSVDGKHGSLPVRFDLGQNFPNPFNPQTTIAFTLPNVQKVLLKVYDALGMEVATLLHETRPVGKNELHFDGTGMPSGIYFYELHAGEFLQRKKMLLVR